MSSSARIDELHRKFDENPRRFFAPLANEYRKAGDLEQAIALCRAHLPHQAGHISGHIVLAQALFDAGERDESREVFHQALELDPENLIALRYLGDIARDRGDLADARHWYQRVLEVDPRNEEMAELTRQVEREQAAARAVRNPTPLSIPAEREEPRPEISPALSEPERPSSGAYAFGDIDIAASGSAYADDLGALQQDARPDLTRPATPAASMPASEEWTPLPGESQADSIWAPARAAEDSPTPVAEASAEPFDVPGASADELLRDFAGADADASDRSPFDAPVAGHEPRLLDLGDLEAAADPFLDDWITPPAAPTPAADPFAAVGYAPTPEADLLPAAGDLTLHDIEADEAPTAPASEFEELSIDVATHPAEDHAEPAAAEPAIAEHELLVEETEPLDVSATTEPPADIESPGEAEGAHEVELAGDIELSEAPVAASLEESGWRASDGSNDDDAAAESAPAAFVTETMAELYLQQGFEQEALDVYRQLLAQRPDDAALRERIETLESASALRAEPAAEPAHASWSEATPELSVEEPVAADEPEPAFSGPLARDFFASLATRRPAGAEPAHADSAWAEPEPVMHAESRAPESVSREAATSGASTAIADDDIEAFNAWLEGLRKP